MVIMKHAGYLTSLKYTTLRNIDCKEEPQWTISTQKSCKKYAKRLKKFTIPYQILNEQSEMILKKMTESLRIQDPF
jgi:hypothetical protein